MKVTVPAKQIEVCDLCKSAGRILTKCVVCRKDYCHICEAIIPGCVHQPDLCRNCSSNERIKEVIKSFAITLHNVLKSRDKAMRAAGKRKRKEKK